MQSFSQFRHANHELANGVKDHQRIDHLRGIVLNVHDQLLQEELKKSQQEKELVQQRARLYLADEQLLQSIASVQQLANMESELEQALERVRARKVGI